MNKMVNRTFEETRRVPFSPSYCVSESGIVTRIGSLLPRKSYHAKRGGYLIVALWECGIQKTIPVHRIVALTFIGPQLSPKHEVAHRDGDKANNHHTNLRWATRAENENDKIAHGRSNRGERNGRAKLTDAQAVDLRALRLTGVSYKELAEIYGISSSAASLIVRKHRRAVS